MDKKHFMKIAKFVFIHLFELAVLVAVSWGIYSLAPGVYRWIFIGLFVALYVFYLINSIIEERKEYKGGDFMVT
jgi:hypothetical protein